jgi:hypothetical protein
MVHLSPLCLPILLPVPRDFITLSEMPQAVLGITCDLCPSGASSSM